MDTQAIKNLQDYLVKFGYMTQDEVNTGYGIYGPKTTRAMNEFQANGGKPKTNVSGASGKTDPNQPLTDAEYEAGKVANPKVKEYINNGSTLEQIQNAIDTGDLSGIYKSDGTPFSAEDQQAAVTQGMEDNRLFYEAQQANDKAATENALAQKQADYQDWLISQGDKFQSDRATMNQDAVNRGVLFSGGNAQKQNKLQSSYNQAQSSKLASFGRDISSTANDYQYKYGNNAANNLSQYYNAGGNTYNMNSARGSVGSSGLSSVYNPGQYNYQGTANIERSAAAQKRAAGYLWNKGNKLLATGYNNQYK